MASPSHQHRLRIAGRSLPLLLVVVMASPVLATEPERVQPAASASQVPAEPLDIDLAKAREAVQWLATLAIDKAPRSFHGDKDWGKSRKVWAGVKIKRDGLRLKTKRRYRELEQGRWVRYEVALPPVDAADPAAITIHSVEPVVDEATGDERWKIDSSVVAPMTFTAQVQRWNLGVKLFSVTVTGRMQVRMRSAMTVGLYPDYTEVPPALEIDPKVDEAHLFLDRFEVDRISRVGGDVAEGWGEVVQEVLVERLFKKQNERLVAKLNQSIDKERDELRFSLAEWFKELQ